MRRLAVLAAACVLLGACSTRALHARDDLWDADAFPDGGVVFGDPAPSERPATIGN